MFPERIETDRLELTALTPEHVDVFDYYDICSGNASDVEAITEYLPWEPHETPKQTADFLGALADQRAAGENAEFVARPCEGEAGAGEIAGAVGLDPDWDRRTGELGIWLRKPFWGRGYYGEAFEELTRVAFERLDLEVVEIVHRHGNEKSRRATEKFVARLGGRHEGRFRNMRPGPDGPDDVHRYTVTAGEYEDALADEEAATVAHQRETAADEEGEP